MNKQFSVLPAWETVDGQSRRAILITNEADKNVLSWGVVGVMGLFAVVVGVIAGFMIDSSFGVATCTGLINFFSFVQGCIVVIYK
jgi:hypothetical protein